MSGISGEPLIHPSAVVDPLARIAADVLIGPYSVIGSGVEIDSGCWIGAHVVIGGSTRIGCGTRVFPFACLGGAPQDKKYTDEDTRLEIGAQNTIREYVTINRGTLQDQGVTRVGDHNWIMAYVHIAHDCRIGNHTVLANNTTLAGHVQVGDHATLGGATLVHQFCAIGAYAFTAFGSVISKDVPPYLTVAGNPARARGLNREGLKRHAFPDATQRALQQAYRALYRSGGSRDELLEKLRQQARQDTHVGQLLEFLEQHQRGIIR